MKNTKCISRKVSSTEKCTNMPQEPGKPINGSVHYLYILSIDIDASKFQDTDKELVGNFPVIHFSTGKSSFFEIKMYHGNMSILFKFQQKPA